jgi:hypothetical protein
VRGWWLAMVVVAGLAGAAAAAVMSVALNVATGGSARWFPGMDRHPLRWSVAATVAVGAAGLLAWWAQRRYDQGLAELVPAVQRPEPWVVDRPAEVGQVVAALERKSGGTVGITTAVQGAGGFGKTTVAKMVRADRRVLRRFRGRVHWVTLGRDAGREALPGLVNGLIAQLSPAQAITFTSSQQASEHLAAVLAKGPRRLLILDDVWGGPGPAHSWRAGRRTGRGPRPRPPPSRSSRRGCCGRSGCRGVRGPGPARGWGAGRRTGRGLRLGPRPPRPARPGVQQWAIGGH